MTQTEPIEPPADSDSTGEPPERRKRPWLLWVILGAALLIILIIGVVVVLIPKGGQPVAHPTPTLPPISATPTPSRSATPTPTPTPSGTPLPFTAGQFTSDMSGYMSDVLNSQNTAVLSQGGTFSDPVYVIAANSDQSGNQSPDDAVQSMQFMFTPEDPNPWNLALPDSTLAQFRAGPYGVYFPAGAIVAESHDGHVFSFIGHDSTITAMFMSASADYLH